MKRILLIILALVVLVSCTDTINNPPTKDEITSLGKKPPKPEPEPQAAFPYLDADTKYIAGRINQDVFIWETNSYSIIWSYTSKSTLPQIAFVNVDNDNKKELVVIESEQGGKGKNKYTIVYFSLFREGVIEPETFSLGDGGDYTTSIWDMKIGNVDGDADDEIVLIRRDRVEVYELTNWLEPSAAYNYGYDIPSTGPWSGELTDYNNDGVNEIIITFDYNFWASYQYSGNSLSKIEQGDSYPAIGVLNVVKAADVDNDGNIEIIGGGSSNNIMVWEDANTVIGSPSYPDFNFTWAIDVAEIDNDPTSKEILFGVLDYGLYSINYNNGTGFDVAVQLIPGIRITNNGLIVTDVNGTGELKIITSTYSGLQVYNTDFSPVPVENVTGILEELICE